VAYSDAPEDTIAHPEVGALVRDDQTKTIPIIAVTALASPEYEKKGWESGCDAYILKPIILDNLLRTIESFLKIGA
jgi:DNA-binding response OmpR family regulator